VDHLDHLGHWRLLGFLSMDRRDRLGGKQVSDLLEDKMARQTKAQKIAAE
jgi:hypothetical protein